MKTQIVQLENHDDITSTLDKISWSKSIRILLVLPERSKLIHTRLDLILLQRKCRKIGAFLALVTQDGDTISLAVEQGIPVFRSIIQAQKSPWRRGRRSRRPIGNLSRKAPITWPRINPLHRDPKPNLNNGLRLFAFFIAIIAFLALIGFFLPSARVDIDRKKEIQQLDLTIIASPEILFPSPSGSIPAYQTSVIVESTQQGLSTGTMIIPGTKAKGVVRFINMTDQMVTIPESTVVQTLSTTPIRFQTDQQVVIPPVLNDSIEVSVTAIEGGESGNVGAGEIQLINTEIGVKIAVTNVEPTSGGTNQSIPAPTVEDYARLRDNLIKELPNLALNELQSMMSGEMQLVPASLKLDSIENETLDPLEGQPGDNCQITIRAKYSALYISNTDIEKASRLAMDANISSDYRAFSDTLSSEALQEPAFVDDDITWNVHLVREIVQSHFSDGVVLNLAGWHPEKARQFLMNNLDLASEPTIVISPSWFPFLPFLSIRIEVNWI
jgi:hypothetical protein